MKNKYCKKYVTFALITLFTTLACSPAIDSSFVKTLNNDTITYDVYFGTTNPPPKVVSNQSDTSYDPPGLLDYNTTYYWKIVAWNEQGESAEGPIWHFKTEEQGINQPPVPIIIAPPTANKKTAIVFDGSESYDPDGTIVNYTWDFGDEAIDYGTIVTHSYQNSGVYKVMLQVTDDDGALGFANHTITIINRAPTASFVADHYIIEPGETVNFDASASSDPDGDSLTYQWDFGDNSNGYGVLVSHIYVNSGNYAVYLTVTDDDQNNPLSDTTSALIRVNSPPVACFTYDPINPTILDIITFDGSCSYDPDGTIVNYSWDFDDGSYDYGMAVQHQYYQNGLYHVILTVMDNYGMTNSTSADVFVSGTLRSHVATTPIFINTQSVSETETETSHVEIVLKEVSYPPHTPRNPFPEDGETNVSVDVVLSWTGGENTPPDAPIITGQTRVKPGVAYIYNFTIDDDDGDALMLFIDWGDESEEVWIGPFEPDQTISVGHIWNEKGTYTIKAKTKDVCGVESAWGYLEVTVPRNRAINLNLLNWLLKRFPNVLSIH